MRTDVDQHIPATHKVVVNERRIADHIVFRKYNLFPDLLIDSITAIFNNEVFIEQRLLDIIFDHLRIRSFGSYLYAGFIDVGGKYFQVELLFFFSTISLKSIASEYASSPVLHAHTHIFTVSCSHLLPTNLSMPLSTAA